MKKIVYIIECMEKGTGKHVIDLYSKLSKEENFEVHVIYGKERSSIDFINKIKKENRYEITNLKRKIGINDIKSFFEIRKVLKEIQPDIVHCHSSKAGLSGRIAAKFCKVKKIIYSPHAYMFLQYKDKSLKQKIYLYAEKVLSKLFTDCTITTSKGEDEAFLNYKIDKKNKRCLIEHGIEKPIVNEKEKSKLRKKLNISSNDFLIGSMARFENQKDPIGTLKIMRNVIKKNPNVKCIFWGNGSLFKEVKELNDSEKDKVLLLGETKEPDLCLSILDLYLTASLYEGLPYTLIESLGLELPIVASNVIGNKDCVFENKNGKLFKAQDYNEAVEKIEELINEKSLEKYKKESLKIFEKRFSIENMINNYKLLYEGNL